MPEEVFYVLICENYNLGTKEIRGVFSSMRLALEEMYSYPEDLVLQDPRTALTNSSRLEILTFPANERWVVPI